MARWIPPPRSFQGQLLNPYPGHRMETMHKKGLPIYFQVCLGMCYVGTLATPSQLSNMQIWPPCEKISHSLTKWKPSFQNWPKNWSLVHGPRLEGHLSTILMSWIQQSWQFVDPNNGHDCVACWIPPPTGFQGHVLNPYPGHRMEIVHQKGVSMGHASGFTKVPCGNASHMFIVEEFAKLTAM